MKKKPDVTLDPSKQVVSQMAAQIYSAHIVRGHLSHDEKNTEWLERSIREAVWIAKKVAASIESEETSEGSATTTTDRDPLQPKNTGASSEPSHTSSRGSEASEKSDFDAVIDEALSERDTPGRQGRSE